MNIIELNLFQRKMQAVCDEMGVTLRRSTISPNIKDRLDYSCAVFDARGLMLSQAAHIPVHLGSMAFSMRDIVNDFAWQEGDMVVMNDPFLGGTHLPDITMIAPVFIATMLVAFVANRAHHANIGLGKPGGMPLAKHIDEEGLLIPPSFLVRKGILCNELMASLAGVKEAMETGTDGWSGHLEAADFLGQIATNRAGQKSFARQIDSIGGVASFIQLKDMLNVYAANYVKTELALIKNGIYTYEDYLDSDGFSNEPIAIRVKLTLRDGFMTADFSGTSPQVQGNVNCPLPVTAAAVFYVVYSLMPADAPISAGMMQAITIKANPGSLVNATFPAAVAAGNVETSMRIVDVLLGALARALPDRIPAAAQGTMNNIAMGGRVAQGASFDWDYYETLAGGLGAHAGGPGLSAVHAHMTNTLNTPIESLESHYPVQVCQYSIRPDSGGAGIHRGGDGVIRKLLFLEPTFVSLLSERRTLQPWGLAGGGNGQSGENWLNTERLLGKVEFMAKVGDVLTVMTPGGGGWGIASVVPKETG